MITRFWSIVAAALMWLAPVSASSWEPGTGRMPELVPLPAGSSFGFAVIGDNRGSSNGDLRPVFVELLGMMRDDRPEFVLHTGDMISGTSAKRKLVRQWSAYVEGLRKSGLAVFHAPGNHDISGDYGAKLYRDLWGETRYSFDYGGARFIALDTTTKRNYLGREQEAWLEARLASAEGLRVFLFFHSPLFPVGSHRGSSLDSYPAERDRLHALLVRHRDRIKGVFQGHEHIHHFEERDGIPYHITGGGGAPLHSGKADGGFHHYLLVHVASDGVRVVVRRPGEGPASAAGR